MEETEIISLSSYILSVYVCIVSESEGVINLKPLTVCTIQHRCKMMLADFNNGMYNIATVV